MKKTLLSLALFLFIGCQVMMAQSVDKFAEKYMAMPEAVIEKADSTNMDEDDFDELQDMAIMGNVDSVTIIDLSGCSFDTKIAFRNEFKTLEIGGSQELVMDAFENKTTLRIIAVREDKAIRRAFCLVQMEATEEENEERESLAVILILHGNMQGVNTEKVQF